MLRPAIKPAARLARRISTNAKSSKAVFANSRANLHSSSSRAATKSDGIAFSKTPNNDGITGARSEPNLATRVDPHQMASEFIRSSPDSRLQGTEALKSVTPEQKMRNYATAATLMGFVAWVWWYSMQSVGRSDGGFEELQAEAAEAREDAERKSLSEVEAERLAEIDVTASNLETEDGEEIGEGVIVAVAAPDEIASKEEDINIAAKEKGGASGRPLWKRVVFFWRRE